MLLFTVAVTLATALLFGMAPAFAGRASLAAGRRSAAGPHPRRRAAPGRSAAPLVVAQVALSLVLVFAAGLFLRTFTALAAPRPRVRRDPVLLGQHRRPAHRPPKAEQRVALVERVVEAVSAVPGVERAAAVLGDPGERHAAGTTPSSSRSSGSGALGPGADAG